MARRRIGEGRVFLWKGRRIKVQYWSSLVGCYGCYDADDPDNGWYDYFTHDQLLAMERG